MLAQHNRSENALDESVEVNDNFSKSDCKVKGDAMRSNSNSENPNKLSFTRRQFLATTGAIFLSQPFYASASDNPDVVIVGAGAAGIAAAHALKKAGRTSVIVEGRGRVGGRAHTDQKIFNAPFDIGAHWLHYDRKNPYNFLARHYGFDLDPSPEVYRLFTDKGEVSNREIDKMRSTYSKLSKAIGRKADAGKDVSASEATAKVKGKWVNTAKFVMGPWSMGKELDDFSTVDWWKGESGDDFFCRQGFGTVVKRHSAGLHISLNTRVETIDWSGQDVEVHTTKGIIRTKAVIVTASTGVLASGKIKFTPQLPDSKLESFHAIPMGLYDHIALQFSKDIFEMGNDGYLLFEIGNDGRGFGTLTNASDTGIAYCDVGGDWARELAKLPIEGKIDYAMNQLEKFLGSSVKRTYLKGTATSWSADEWTLGSFASAKPGAFSKRKDLRKSIGNRIFFAGEACHRSMWATVGGAHMSGKDTGKLVARKIG